MNFVNKMLKRKPNLKAHDVKNAITKDVLEIQSQSKKLRQHSQELRKKIEQTVAYKVAYAAGRIR